MRKLLVISSAVLFFGVALFGFLVFTGPTVYCPSVWVSGSLANDEGRNQALRSISLFEGTERDVPNLLSVSRVLDEGRTVKERWKVKIREKEVLYLVEFFYIPGGPVCGPEFRSASIARQ